MVAETSEKTRTILVVDDEQYHLNEITNWFSDQKQNGFNGLGFSDDVRNLLMTLELEPRLNSSRVDRGEGENTDASLDNILESMWSRHNGSNAYSGIISDFAMPMGDSYPPFYRKSADQEELAIDDAVIKPAQQRGGLQLAKIAQMAHIPLVFFTGGSEEAQEDSPVYRLRGFKPVNPVPPIHGKRDYVQIFTSLANAIIANEKSAGTGIFSVS